MLVNLKKAIDHLKMGQIIAYPTESVYGLGVDPSNKEAVFRLLNLKKREPQKGLIIITHDFSNIEDWIVPLTLEEKSLLLTLNHGYTHTWLLPFSQSCPDYLYGNFKTIAIRITQHPISKDLCRAFGAIVSTSANISGNPPATNQEQIINYFGQAFPILEGQLGGLQSPTKIVELKSNKVIRE